MARSDDRGDAFKKLFTYVNAGLKVYQDHRSRSIAS